MNPKRESEEVKLLITQARATIVSNAKNYQASQTSVKHHRNYNGHDHGNGNAKRLRVQSPSDPENITAPHPDQSHWSVNNLPSVLYALRGSQYSKSRARVRITESKIFDKHVRDFQVLPRQISSKVEGWRLEAWWRLDRRIEAQDILDRINPKNGVTMLDLETRREQFRRSFRVADWKSQSSVNEITRLVKMAGIDPNLNTTRGLTPGLVDPSKGEAGGRIPVPASKEKFVDFSGPRPFFAIPGLHGQRNTVSSSSSPFLNKAVIRSPSQAWVPGQPIKAVISPGQMAHQRFSPIPFPAQLPGHISPHRLVQKRRIEELTKPITPPLKIHKLTTPRRVLTTPASYPETQCELASHQGSPVFRETRVDRSTMSLEEYLERNHMSYEEYLCRGEDDLKENKDGKEGLKGKGSEAVVTTPSKGNVVDPWLSVL